MSTSPPCWHVHPLDLCDPFRQPARGAADSGWLPVAFSDQQEPPWSSVITQLVPHQSHIGRRFFDRVLVVQSHVGPREVFDHQGSNGVIVIDINRFSNLKFTGYGQLSTPFRKTEIFRRGPKPPPQRDDRVSQEELTRIDGHGALIPPGACEPGSPPYAGRWAVRNQAMPQDSESGPASLAEPIASAKALCVDDAEAPPDSETLTAQHLDVYATKNGPWNPEHGDIEIPADWEFLPSGDAFLTRTVKAAGAYWLSWQPRSRHRQHRRLLGLWAPSQAIADAQVRAEATAERREAKRALGAQSRERHEERYRGELEDAIVRFLAFAPEYQELARRIAKETAAHAAVVGSGRVGRTRKLTLDERAALVRGPTSGTPLRAITTISMRCRQSTGTRSTSIERSKERRTTRSIASSSSIAAAGIVVDAGWPIPETLDWRRPVTVCARGGLCGLPSGHEGDDDVGSMAVEVLPPAVVDGRGPRVGVAGGELDVTQRHSGVEGRRDEGRSGSMWGWTIPSPALLPILRTQRCAVRRCEALAVPTVQDRAPAALAEHEVDRAGHPGDREGITRRLVAFADYAQHFKQGVRHAI